MTDFEARVTEALTSYVDDVCDPAGLADGARARRRRRSRRRLVVGAAVVVVVGVAVPLGVAALHPGDARSAHGAASEVVDEADDGWRTVVLEDTQVEIPPGWTRRDRSGCEFDFEWYAPPDVDGCDNELGVSFYSSATFDPGFGPGVRSRAASSGLSDAPWSGWGDGGTYDVDVGADDRAVASRVLASVTDVGPSPVPPESVRLEQWRGLSVEVPVSWFAQEAPCVRSADPGEPAIEFPPKGNYEASTCTSVSQGYGARFFDSSLADFIRQLQSGNLSQTERDGVPPGAWVGQVSSTSNPSIGVFVVARDRATARAVLDSVRYRNEVIRRPE